MTVRVPESLPRDSDAAVRVCEPMCRALAGAYYAPGVDADDLLQAARLGAWEAWRDWRPDGGSSFHGFARLCITRELASTVLAARRLKHRPVSDAVRLRHRSRTGRSAQSVRRSAGPVTPRLGVSRRVRSCAARCGRSSCA